MRHFALSKSSVSAAFAVLFFMNLYCSDVIVKNLNDPIADTIQSINMNYLNRTIDILYEQYVSSENGLIDYQNIWKDNRLQSLLDTFAVFVIDSFQKREDQLSFWINAYNALVIYYMQDFGLTKNQEELKFPLFKTKYPIGHKRLTLDEIEKAGSNAPIKAFNDPRTHFVLVCGALSCPPLLSRAYSPDSLYEQMDRKTKNFINNDQLNPILAPSGPKVSSLFKWYATDFNGYRRDETQSTKLSKKTGGSVKDFILSYLSDSKKIQAIQNNALEYEPYDWAINKQ